MQGTSQEPGPKRVMVSKERGRTAQLRLEVPHVNGVTKCRWPVVASDKHQRDWFRPYNRVPCRSM